MANTLRFKRGLVATIPTAALGEPLFTTDTFDLYIGNGTTNTRFQKYIASGTTSQLLRGDGSLLTMPIVLTSPSNGQVLKYNGTNWVNDSDSGITGSGSAGQVAYWSGTNTQVGSNNLFWDSSVSRLGVGTNNPAYRFHAISSDVSIGAFRNSGAAIGQLLVGNTAGDLIIRILASGDSLISSDTSKYLAFGTNGGTERMRLDASGNLGLGVTPSAWGGTFRALQIGLGTSLYNNAGGNGTFLGSNFFFNGTNNIYLNSTTASAYGQTGGQHQWFTAPSGTAGNTITFTQAMTLTANGRLLLGTTTEGTFLLDVNGAIRSSGLITAATEFRLNNQSFTRVAIADTGGGFAGGYNLALSGGITPIHDSTGAIAGIHYRSSGTIQFYTGGSQAANTNATERMRIDANGNVGIGTTSLTGFTLRVNKNITGAATSYGVRSDGIIQSDVSGQAIGFDSSLGTQAAAFTLPVLTHYRADQSTFGAGSAVTTQYGFQVRSNLIGATNNYGFFGDIASGTGRWNLYMNGTAANFLRGNTAINTTTINDNGLTINQSVNGTNVLMSLRNDAGNADNEVSIKMIAGSFTAGEFGTILTHRRIGTGGAAFIIKTNATLGGTPIEAGRFTQSQNLHLGAFSADSGEKLQVNGTMKVTGASSFGGNISVIKNSGSPSVIEVTDGTNTTTTEAYLRATAGTTQGYVLSWGQTKSTYKILAAGDVGLYKSNTAGDVAIFNDATSGSIKMAAGGSSTAHFTIASTGAATFSSSIQSATAIAIGTTPDTNKPFKILKSINGTVGINFENTSTGSLAFSAIQMGTDVTGGTKLTNLVYASSGITQSGVYHPDGTALINIGNGGLNLFGTPTRFYTGGSNGTLRLMLDNEGTTQYNATTPTTNATDGYKQYSADVVAGNAAPHFRTENGAVIKLYQETTAVGNAIFSQGGGNAVLDDSTFAGYTLRQIVQALRNQGILA